MKIIHIIYTLSSGGAERFVVDLANQQAKIPGNKVTILILKTAEVPAFAFYRPEISEEVEFLYLNNKKATPLVFFQIYNIIKRLNPDVVHMHLYKTPLSSILAIMNFKRPLYIETLHNKADVNYESFLVRVVSKFLYKSNRLKIVTISPENDASFLRFMKMPSNGMILNGRRKIAPTPLYEDVKKEIDGYKKTKETTVILNIARCDKQKNHQLLIASINRLVQEGEDVIQLIIGDGYDTSRGKELRKQACQNIHFLGVKRNVADYLNYSDAFCLSSLFEGMPISLIEALQCGCVPICTPVSGVIDMLEPGITGFISKDFSEEGLSEVIRQYIRSKSKVDINKIKSLYEQYFSIESCAKQYQEVYEKYR